MRKVSAVRNPNYRKHASIGMGQGWHNGQGRYKQFSKKGGLYVWIKKINYNRQ